MLISGLICSERAHLHTLEMLMMQPSAEQAKCQLHPMLSAEYLICYAFDSAIQKQKPLQQT